MGEGEEEGGWKRRAQTTQTMTRSKVQNIPMPVLDQTAAQSPGYVADLELASLREKESKKAPPRQARRQRGTKPGQQTKMAAFSRKSELSNKQRKEKTDPHSAEGSIGTIQKRGNCSPRAVEERKSSEHVKESSVQQRQDQ